MSVTEFPVPISNVRVPDPDWLTNSTYVPKMRLSSDTTCAPEPVSVTFWFMPSSASKSKLPDLDPISKKGKEVRPSNETSDWNVLGAAKVFAMSRNATFPMIEYAQLTLSMKLPVVYVMPPAPKVPESVCEVRRLPPSSNVEKLVSVHSL